MHKLAQARVNVKNALLELQFRRRARYDAFLALLGLSQLTQEAFHVENAQLGHTVYMMEEIAGPLLALNVCGKSSKALLRLGEDGLLTCLVVSRIRFVKSITCSNFSVHGVRRVSLGGLVRSVGSSLRVRGTISDHSEDRESWGFTGGGVGNSRDEHGSGSGSSRKSFPSGGLLFSCRWLNE